MRARLHTPTGAADRPRIRAPEIVALVAAYAAVRLPFLSSFDMVSHDGTYYIVQAHHLFSGAFPPGYPALIAAFSSVIRDGVRAAQTASAVAGVVATLALYVLGRRLLPRGAALACAFVVATTPVFVRATLDTMSESTYVAWVLLALLAYADGRRAWAGLALGAAAMTRPEAVAIAAVLVAVDARRGRRSTAILAVGFLAVYAAGVALSALAGHATLMSKWQLFGASARGWSDFDATVDGGNPARPGAGAVIAGYAAALPADLATLFRHVAGAAFVFAVAGLARRRTFVAAALVPLAVVPLFTYRVEARFIVPFVPVCVLLGFIGAASIAGATLRRAAYAALVIAAAVGLVANRAELTRRESAGFEPAREAGRALAARVGPGARIADRKPFLAFYAGARYVEIPRGSYAEVTADVYRNADYLALMRGVTDFFRPALEPLLYDADTILGESRFAQIYANDGGVLVYARADSAGVGGGLVLTPVASIAPDAPQSDYSIDSGGARVAFAGGAGGRSLLLWACASNAVTDTLTTRGARVSQPAWSPDGTRVAFVCAESGNPDVFVVGVRDREVTRVTDSAARDLDPAWDGDWALVFTSDRSGSAEVWRVRLRDDEPPEQRTFGGGNHLPAVSPDGTRLAWVDAAGTVVVRDRERHVEWMGSSPAHVVSPPRWSPDGGCLAVAARDWGDSGVYLLRPDVTRGLRLSPLAAGADAPQWAGEGLFVAADVEGARSVAAVGGLAPYLARLAHPGDLRVFIRPTAR